MHLGDARSLSNDHLGLVETQRNGVPLPSGRCNTTLDSRNIDPSLLVGTVFGLIGTGLAIASLVIGYLQWTSSRYRQPVNVPLALPPTLPPRPAAQPISVCRIPFLRISSS